jgi:high-affinity Fe2+/Pb2+ permease
MKPGATSSKTASGKRLSALHWSAPTSAAVLGLSLLTWLVFYSLSMRLDGPGTTVVVGFWLLLVLAGQWAKAHFRKKRPQRRTAK